MDVLVVGGTGPLGAAVTDRTDGTAASRQTGFEFFADDPHDLVAAHDPDAVVVDATTAAATDPEAVPIPEYVDAVGAFVDACADRRLVCVSGAAVFDGADGRYEPDDVRTPKDGRGRRLQVFEDQAGSHDRGVVVRPGRVYAADPLSPRLAAARDALADGGPCRRYDDVYRSYVHVADAAAAVAELAAGDSGGVFHVPGSRLSVYEFHERALSALGVDTGGLEAAAVPEDESLARDRSLAGPRFETELAAAARPPTDAL